MGGTENIKYNFLSICNQDGKTLYKFTMPISTISEIECDPDKIEHSALDLAESVEFTATVDISFWNLVKLFGFWLVVKSKISHIFRRYKKNA